MTGALVGFMVLLAGLLALNLLATFGLVRRVREHEQQLSERDATNVRLGLPVGTPLPPFHVTDASGHDLHPATWPSQVVVAFFSTTCDACRDHLPPFLEWATQHDRDATVCVIDGPIPDALAMAGSAGSVTRLVLEPAAQRLASAFGITGIPVLFQVTDGRVTASGTRMQQLPLIQAAS